MARGDLMKWSGTRAVVIWLAFAAVAGTMWISTEHRRMGAAVEYGMRATSSAATGAESFFTQRVRWQHDLATSYLSGDVDNDTLSHVLVTSGSPFGLVLDADGIVIATYPVRSDIPPGTDLRGVFSHIDAALEGTVGYWTIDAGARTETGTIVAVATPYETADGRRVLSTAFELGSVALPSEIRTAVTRLSNTGLAGIVDDNGILLSGDSLGDVSQSAERVLGADATREDVVDLLASSGVVEYRSHGTTRYAYTYPLADGSLHLVTSFDSDDLLGAVGGPPMQSRVGVPLALLVLALVLWRRTEHESDMESEERVFTSEVAPMLTTDADGRIRHSNSEARRLLGRSAGDLAGRRLDELRPDGAVDIDTRLTLTDGSVRHTVFEGGPHGQFAVSIATASMPDPRPGGSAYVHLLADESTSVATQARIAAQANEWRALIEHSPIPLALIDNDHRVERVNEALVALAGRPASELVGHRAIDVLSSGLDDGPLARLLTRVKADDVVTIDHRVQRPDGTVAEVRSVAIGIPDRDGTVLRTVLQLLDVTEANRLEREAARSREALEQFASRAAHDLKSPLSTIAGFANLIEAGTVEDTALGEMVARIRRSASRASTQVQALLDHAMTMANAEMVEVDLREVRSWLEDLLATELMSTSGSIDLDTDTPFVMVDEVPFRQILHNLCTNSMKYARPNVPPRIVIRTETDRDLVHVIVEDNGRGFDGAAFEDLFEAGFQSDSESPGVGMGLATVRALADGLGGSIHAEPRLPHGLKMILTLPGQETALPISRPATVEAPDRQPTG